VRVFIWYDFSSSERGGYLRFRVMLWLALVLCALTTLYSHAQNSGNTQAQASAPVTTTITQYSLPPDKLEKAHALYTVRTTLHFVETIYGLLLLLLVLRFRLGPKFRDFAERVTHIRFFQAFLFVPLLTIVLDLLSMPFSLYGHHLSLRYGLSVQRWGSWLWDWTKGELIGLFIGSLLIWLLYWLIRKSPTLWWFYAWLLIMPIMIFLMWLMPVVLDPVFNKFEPLAKEHVDLVAATQKIAKAAGVDMPADRMFLMKASEKVTTANAYVTGVGSTKRVVVWDTTAQQMTVPQATFVIGHEMGHYVLHHIRKGLMFASVMLFFAFWLTYRCINWFVARWGKSLSVREVADWASLPALMLIASLIGFVAEPIANNFARRLIEHKADIYGLQITSGITLNYREVAAQSFQNLGEHSLSYPYPSKLMVFWLYDHPDISSRVDFALHFDPK
jgi:STE24 endopeptidase